MAYKDLWEISISDGDVIDKVGLNNSLDLKYVY